MKLPKKEASDILELLPKYDCGLCGNPRCMTFSRRILLGLQKADECLFLSKENIEKIIEIAGAPDVQRKHPHPNQDGDIIEINPCTEDGFVTLETQLRSKVMAQDLFADFFDQFQLCLSLTEVDIFDKMNCSSKMGYALAEISGKRTHVFKTGKIIMRRADDKEDALKTLSKISMMLLPARLCSCNNTLVDCFGGSCKICSEGSCAALIDGTEIGQGYESEGYTIGNVLNDINMNNYPNLSENFKIIGDIISNIRKIDEYLRNGKEIDAAAYKNETEELAKKIGRSCTECQLQDNDISKTLIALIQCGIVKDILRARDGLLSIKVKGDSDLYEKATGIFFDAYSAFENRDQGKIKEIGKRYEEFIAPAKENLIPYGLIKVAANGFYISRILGKPAPHRD
jgi:ArsR family metal-binding transcriptional regulator